MDRQEAVLLIAVIDILLACLGIVNETLSLTFGEKNFSLNAPVNVLTRKEGEENGTESSEEEDLTILMSSSQNSPATDNSRFVAFILMVSIVFGIFFMQLFMATKLLSASKVLRSQPLSALQKFSCWRIWSLVYICLLSLMLSIVLVLSIERRRWTDWLLYVFLSVQIIFRAYSIYYISVCRKHVKDGLVHPMFSIPSTFTRPPPPPPTPPLI